MFLLTAATFCRCIVQLLNMTKLQLHNELAGNRAALAKCGIPEK